MSEENKNILEMSFPVTNNFIKKFNKTCCFWGQKKTIYDAEGNIRGKI
jgi:hypothetical protein